MSMSMETQARKIDNRIRHSLGADSAFNVRVGAASEVDPGEQEYEFEVTIEYGTNTYFLGARGYNYGICEIEIGEGEWVEMTVRSIYMYLFSAQCERSLPLHTESK